MRQNPLQLAAGRAGSCRADSTCRHQSEKGLVILAHCPFGPRGSTVSGRHLHAAYGDFATPSRARRSASYVGPALARTLGESLPPHGASTRRG